MCRTIVLLIKSFVRDVRLGVAIVVPCLNIAHVKIGKILGNETHMRFDCLILHFFLF